MIATNTAGASRSRLLELRGAQYWCAMIQSILESAHSRKQNKKHRPILAVTPTLTPWLQAVTDPTLRYVAYGRSPIKSITTAWELLVEEAGLDERVTPYSIRHGMAREMRKRKGAQRARSASSTGIMPKDSDATTSIYAPYDPRILFRGFL